MIYYSYAIYKFISELIVSTALFVLCLKRRKTFWLVLPLCLAVFYLASSFWNGALAGSVILMNIRYFVLFALVVAGIFVCFKQSVQTALFCCISGYAAQHITYRIWDLFDKIIFESVPYALFIILYIIFFAVLYAAFYFIFARRIAKPEIIQESNKTIVMLGIALIIFTVVLYSLFYRYTEKSVITNIIVASYACICCLLVLAIQSGMFKNSRQRQEFQMMKQFWHKEKEQLELTKEYIDIINLKCHDMKHQLSLMGGRLSESEINELGKTISVYGSSVSTGNEILDIVVAEKSMRCGRENINLAIMANAEALEFMSATDIYSLFGNIVDNAMDAVKKIDDIVKRTVSLYVKDTRGVLSVHCENYYSGDILFVGGLPQTTKKDEMFHGFGTKSIRSIAEKYGGYMKIKTAGEVFYLDVIIPLQKQKS